MWIYDLRTNKNFSLRERPISEPDLSEFIESYGTNAQKRRPSERFKKFSRQALMARPRVNMNLSWLRDASIASAADLADPDEIATDIAKDLRAALAEFEELH